MRSWVFGSGTECDIVVESALASGRHCELAQVPEGYVLTDLGSTNGTFVNGLRITSPTRVSISDQITLGRTVPLPWPSQATRHISIGRLDDNDIVLDDARVSGHHARLIIGAGSLIQIEDIGSSNGTYLNSADRRLTGPTPITERDTLYFGTLVVPATRLLAGLKVPGPAAPARAPGPPTVFTQPLAAPPVAPAAVAAPGKNRWLPVWMVAQAPVFALLIIAAFGRQSAQTVTAESWASVEQGIASVTFALALAALCLGGSLAVADLVANGPPGRQAGSDSATFLAALGYRTTVLAALCAGGCVLMLTLVYWGSGLTGPWLAMCVVIVMASLAALFFGLSIAAVARSWAATAAVLLACLMLMIVLGGRIWPLPAMPAPVRWLAEAMPARWAFEGLFLLETAQHREPLVALPAETVESTDLVDDLFPATSDRMGSRADAMALGSMLIGLAALAVFAWAPAGRDP